MCVAFFLCWPRTKVHQGDGRRWEKAIHTSETQDKKNLGIMELRSKYTNTCTNTNYCISVSTNTYTNTHRPNLKLNKEEARQGGSKDWRGRTWLERQSAGVLIELWLADLLPVRPPTIYYPKYFVAWKSRRREAALLSKTWRVLGTTGRTSPHMPESLTPIQAGRGFWENRRSPSQRYKSNFCRRRGWGQWALQITGLPWHREDPVHALVHLGEEGLLYRS